MLNIFSTQKLYDELAEILENTLDGSIPGKIKTISKAFSHKILYPEITKV